ncbi:hypothetical protein JCM10213_007101 [Rhodosporidiobolus nylandii]
MPNSPGEDDGFTSVSYKKPARAPRNRKGKGREPPRERSIEEKLASRAGALKESGYLRKCRDLLKNALAPPVPAEEDALQASASSCPKPESVVCLGLGSLADSLKAQEQYLLLKELLEELDGVIDADTKVEFYDPVFSPEDAAFLTSQGHSVLSAEYPLRLTRPTLLYIPHGPRTLFDALLRVNWTSPEQLQRCTILGNRLDLYDDPTYSGSTAQSGRRAKGGKEAEGGDELGESAEFVVRAAKIFHIVPLPETKEHLQAFNDLALEWLVPERVDGQGEEFWRKEEAVEKEMAGRVEAEGKVEQAVEELEKLSLQ